MTRPPQTPFRLMSFYGPCENSLGVTCMEAKAGMSAPPFLIGAPGPAPARGTRLHTRRRAGKPQPNTQVLILDAHMQLVPLGVHGEMYLGGVQLGRGYYKARALR